MAEDEVQQAGVATEAEHQEAVPSLGERLEEATSGQEVEASASAVQAEQWEGILEAARARGIELPYQEDGAALEYLLDAHRRLQERNYYADLGQRVAPHAEQIREYLGRQQQPVQQAPPAWAPPEFRKEWLQQVERDDATGLLRSKPGYDPTLAEKVTRYAEWREQFLDSPEKVIGPLVEERARALIREELAGVRQQTEAERLVAGHASWLFQKDEQGAFVTNPQTGMRQLTPEGVLYARATEHLFRQGVRDSRELDRQALIAVENAVLRRHYQAQQAATSGDVRKAQATRGAATGGGGARPAVGVRSGGKGQGGGGLTLRERLNRAMAGEPEDLD